MIVDERATTDHLASAWNGDHMSEGTVTVHSCTDDPDEADLEPMKMNSKFNEKLKPWHARRRTYRHAW